MCIAVMTTHHWLTLNSNIARGFPVVNYYHKELHLGCCSSPRSASDGTAEGKKPLNDNLHQGFGQ